MLPESPRRSIAVQGGRQDTRPALPRRGQRGTGRSRAGWSRGLPAVSHAGRKPA